MLGWNPNSAANIDIGLFALEHLGDNDFGGCTDRVFTFEVAMIAVVQGHHDEPRSSFPKKGGQVKVGGLPAVGRTQNEWAEHCRRDIGHIRCLEIDSIEIL